MFQLFLMCLVSLLPADDSLIVKDATAKPSAEIRIPAPEAGQLMELKVREGHTVTSGQMLGRVDDRLATIERDVAKLEYDIAVEQSTDDIDLRFAEKSLAVAESELKLSRAAVQRAPGSIAQTEMDQLKLVVEKSLLSIEQAGRDQRIARMTANLKKRAMAATEARLTRRQIRAPTNGMVVEVFAEPGEWVAPGDPVIRILQTDRLRIEFHVDGRLYGQNLRDKPVSFAVEVPGRKVAEVFEGRVTFVSPEVQPVNGRVKVWAEVKNRDQMLRPGVHGVLTVTLDQSTPVTAESPAKAEQ